jgi:hypothetical protein
MTGGQQKRTSWGRPRDFIVLVICITIIGVAAAARWRALDLVFALAWLGICVVGSVSVLWRAWKHRTEPTRPALGQLAALPRSWRKWVLGESDDNSRQ